MRKNIFLPVLLTLSLFVLSGCSMPFSKSDDSNPREKRDNTEEPSSPDSGDEIDTSKPGGPDSGDEVELGPDSGDEIDLSGQPDGPGSGPEGDMPDAVDEDEEDDDDDSDGPQTPDSGDEIDTSYDQNAKSPDSGEEAVSLNDTLKAKAKGSCNAISKGSTCVEYIGSFWTTSQAKLNCSTSGVFSTKPCPRPALGGCRIGIDSSSEIVTLHYSYGGDPYTEVIIYAKQSCNALPGSQWIQ